MCHRPKPGRGAASVCFDQSQNWLVIRDRSQIANAELDCHLSPARRRLLCHIVETERLAA